MSTEIIDGNVDASPFGNTDSTENEIQGYNACDNYEAALEKNMESFRINSSNDKLVFHVQERTLRDYILEVAPRFNGNGTTQVEFSFHELLNPENGREQRRKLAKIINEASANSIKINKSREIVTEFIGKLINEYETHISENYNLHKKIKELRRNGSKDFDGRTYSYNGMPLPSGFFIGVGSDAKNLYRALEDDDGYETIAVHIGSACTIKKIGRSDDSNTYLTLVYTNNANVEVEFEYPQFVFRSRKGLELAAKDGFTVIEGRTNDMLEYFDSILLAEDRRDEKLIEIENVTKENGWKDSEGLKIVFVSGPETYSKNGVQYKVIEKALSPHLGRAGTLEEWIEAVGDLIYDPVVRAKCYIAMAAIINKYLYRKGIIIAHIGPTSGGKTFSTQIALSLLCHPLRLTKSLKSTDVSVEVMLNVMNDHPLLLDEASTKKYDMQSLEMLIYFISQNEGKNRSNIDLGLQEQILRTNIVFLTSESNILTSASNDGESVRLIEITKSMKKDFAGVERFEKTFLPGNEQYGHILPLYLERVFNTDLDAEYEKQSQKYINKEDVRLNRMSKFVALVAVAASILEDVFESIGIERMDYDAVINEVIVDSIKDTINDPIHIRALAEFCSQLDIKEMYFNYPDAGANGVPYNREIIGCNTTPGEIHVFPKVFKDFCEKAGYPYDTILKMWKDEGIIKTNPSRGNRYSVRRSGKQVICFNNTVVFVKLSVPPNKPEKLD